MKDAVLLLLVALLSGLGAPRRAHASALGWKGPPECAASEQLRFEVERALGESLERASRLDFEVEVALAATGSSASARLRVISPEAGAVAKERAFVAPDCSKLVDTLAVAVTFAIASFESGRPESDRPESDRPEPAAPDPPDPPAAPVAPQPAAPAEAEPGARDASGLHPSVLFSLLGDSGSLPAPAAGASLGVELALGPFALRALGTLLFEQRVRLASPDGDAAADLGLTFGTLQGCANALSARSSLAIPLCAGADAGVLSGSGVSIARPQRASAAWLAPRADTGMLWDIPFTRLRVGALLTAAVPLTRDEFVVGGIGAVHRASRVVGRASLGLALGF